MTKNIKLDILAIGIHPDDVELSAAGTILKHIKLGKKAGILDLSKGEMGTRGNAKTRNQEALEASKILGINVRQQLDIEDCFFENNKSNQLKIIEVIRYYQPDIVLCNAISDRHPDHSRAAKLVADACFYAGLSKIKTTANVPWKIKALYHYIQDQYLQPDFVIDITPHFNKKMESILAYKSQFYNPNSKEPNTPISSKEFLDYIKAKAILFGRPINCAYAEGFTKSRIFGVQNLFNLQ